MVYRSAYFSTSAGIAPNIGTNVTKTNNMRHVEKARNILENEMDKSGAEMHLLNYIQIENTEDVKGVAPILKFTIQSDPIGEVGVNGCQALDMLKYVKCLFQSLNDAFYSYYNVTTIVHIEKAIQAQESRTQDRINRQVEGQNKD